MVPCAPDMEACVERLLSQGVCVISGWALTFVTDRGGSAVSTGLPQTWAGGFQILFMQQQENDPEEPCMR